MFVELHTLDVHLCQLVPTYIYIYAMNRDSLFFNTATLVAGVFVLDYGADKFIDHTVIVGQRLGISPTLIALLTAGAEYEAVNWFELHHLTSLC